MVSEVELTEDQLDALSGKLSSTPEYPLSKSVLAQALEWEERHASDPKNPFLERKDRFSLSDGDGFGYKSVRNIAETIEQKIKEQKKQKPDNPDSFLQRLLKNSGSGVSRFFGG